MPTLLLAQSLTNKQRRIINSKVLSIIEEYEQYAALYDDEAAYYFGELFTDDATIVSDMIGAPSYLRGISSDDYINQLMTNSVNTTVAIRDVSKGQIYYANGKWIIPVRFKKSISYIDNNGYIFSVSDFYSKDVDVKMDLVYDEEYNSCLIASIESTVDSYKKFPEGRFYIIDREKIEDSRAYNKYMSTLKINNASIEYNNLGVAYVSQGGDFSVYDLDVEVKPKTVLSGFNYDVTSFDFKSKSLRLKPRFAWAPLSAYKVQNNNGLNVKSSAMEAGLDFGVTAPAGRNCKIGFYIGAGISMSNLDLSFNGNYSYIYYAPIFNKENMAFNFEGYEYNVTSATESVKYMDLYVPLYLDFEFRMGRHLLLTLDLGAKAYLNMSAKVASPYTVNYSLNGTQLPSFTPDSFIVPNTYAKKPFDVSGIANIGLDINLYKSRIYFVVEAGYEYGITKSFESTTSTYISASGSKDKKPIIPALKQDGSERQGDVATYSLISGLTTKRNAIWFTTGLKFKM
jgi:hypothetical protein